MERYLLTALFSVWINLIYGINIQPIPEHPVIDQPVTLSVSGVSGAIHSFSWYRSSGISNSSLILSYNPTSNPAETQGPKYFPRASSFSNGSLHIVELSTTDSGYYTVQVQAGSLTSQYINLPVYVPVVKPVIRASSQRPVEYDELWFFFILLPSMLHNFVLFVPTEPVTASGISTDNKEPQENQPVTLTCSANNAEQILWGKNGVPLPPGLTLSADNRTLTFPRICRSDTGQYRCEASNAVSKIISDPYTLTVNYYESHSGNSAAIIVAIICGSILGIVLISGMMTLLYRKYVLPLRVPVVKPVIRASSQRPVEYDEVALTCTAANAQRFLWSRIGGKIPSGVKYSSNNSSMTISRITLSDAGKYQCEGMNPVFKDISETYTLSLYCVCADPPAGVLAGIICGTIAGIALIACATFLLYRRFILPARQVQTGQVNSQQKSSEIYDNVIDGTKGQNPTVESPYTGLQHQPDHTYCDLNMGQIQKP
eukprot:XP_017951218.1 PREDICTED: carcinoembryonic antigen-related cell adhesion molecule 1-like [Xenopus tropicalis]